MISIPLSVLAGCGVYSALILEAASRDRYFDGVSKARCFQVFEAS